ncbi:hypothetical protein R1sor_008051 [Riccia sorocarpa]|uniref:Uncharacterized protein n=1 Tax=Riccia sorocarpa TaxID=122646 RepID=A0ABD3HWB4_9MARC
MAYVHWKTREGGRDGPSPTIALKLYGRECRLSITGSWPSEAVVLKGPRSPTLLVTSGATELGTDVRLQYSGQSWVGSFIGFGFLPPVIYEGTTFVANLSWGLERSTDLKRPSLHGLVPKLASTSGADKAPKVKGNCFESAASHPLAAVL